MQLIFRPIGIMAASKQTIDELVKTIRSWEFDWDIHAGAIVDLLTRLGGVSGNKSFSDTIQRLRDSFSERETEL